MGQGNRITPMWVGGDGVIAVAQQMGNVTTTERRYSLTNHTDAAHFAEAAVFRHIALTIGRQEPSTSSKRKRAAGTTTTAAPCWGCEECNRLEITLQIQGLI